MQLGGAATGLVYYAYRIHARSVTGTFRARRADYPLLRNGRRLTVTYLPGNTAIHRLGAVNDGRVLREGAASLLLLLCCCVYGVAPFVALERALRRELYLARYGVQGEGVICRSKPLYRNGKLAAYDVQYDLELSEGQVSRGRARIGHREGEPTLIGFPIAVLYDPVRPQYHRPAAALRAVSFRPSPVRPSLA